MTRDEQIGLLEELRETAHKAAKDIAIALRRKCSPAGYHHQTRGNPLPACRRCPVAVHYSHSPYYVRRCASRPPPSCKVCEDLGYPVLAGSGTGPGGPHHQSGGVPRTGADRPVKANVSAIEQLENYKMFIQHYVDHNCSITVHVRDNEWDEVEQWVWENWDDVVALSFLSYDDNFYELMPYEAIDQAGI